LHVAMLTDLAAGDRPVGGVQRAVITLAETLVQAGIDVTIIAPARPGQQITTGSIPLTDTAYRIQRIEMSGRYQAFREFVPYRRAVATALGNLRPDIVHAHGLLHNGAAAAGADLHPTILTAHGDPLADARAHYPRAIYFAVSPFLARTIQTSIRGADRLVNVTPEWHVNLPEPPRRMVHIPNAIEPLFFREHSTASTSADPSSQKRVLFFGGSRKIKGADLLATAWPSIHRSHADAELVTFGLEGQVAKHLKDLDGVTLHDSVDSSRVAEEMARGGVVAIPSRYEVAPLLIPEGWASDAPIVATDVGGVRAMAEGAALICEPEPPSIAAAIGRALEGGQEIETFVAEGASRARLHDPRAIAAMYVALYEELLEEGVS